MENLSNYVLHCTKSKNKSRLIKLSKPIDYLFKKIIRYFSRTIIISKIIEKIVNLLIVFILL